MLRQNRAINSYIVYLCKKFNLIFNDYLAFYL